MKTNISDVYIMNVYKNANIEKVAVINRFTIDSGLKITCAFGGYYLNIDDVFQEDNNGLKNDFTHYGMLNFLGNINGKCEYQLYFKNNDLMHNIKSFRARMTNINEELRESIKCIIKDHGEPGNQLSILNYISNK